MVLARGRPVSRCVCTFMLSAILLTFPVMFGGTDLAFAGGHEDTGELEHVVDTDNLSGLSLTLANLYNDHRTWFAVVTTVFMAVLGAIISLGTEFFLNLAGFKVTKSSRPLRRE